MHATRNLPPRAPVALLLCAVAFAACNAADDRECSPCLDRPLSWTTSGGLAPSFDETTLDGCNRYRHTRTPNADPNLQPTLACERELPCTASGLHGVSDVLAALSHPDLEAAAEQGTVLFGRDPRAVDGTLFRIELTGSSIDVGSPCTSMDAGCTPSRRA